jgi:hypothetical protein
MATAAVLLMNPEIGPTRLMVAPSCRETESRVNRAMRRPSDWTMPVRWTPAERMNIASTVSVADEEKPEVPSAGEIPVRFIGPAVPSTISATMIPMAVMSTGTGSTANSTSATTMMAKTANIPGVTGGSVTPEELLRRVKSSRQRVVRSGFSLHLLVHQLHVGHHLVGVPTLPDAVEHGGPDVTVRVGPLDNGFYIEDTGPGIPSDHQDTVVDHGVTTKETGSGYGLSVVRTFTNAHGWDVRTTESKSGGARFEITSVDFLD